MTPKVKKKDEETIELRRIAHARSGDKGGNVNIGLIAVEPEYYDLLLRYVTADAVKDHFGPLCGGEVKRFEMPNIYAINFLLFDALDGGGTISLRTDSQGKTFGAALLRLTIALTEAETDLLRKKRAV